ncbi:MAG TPA: polysaccharide deacetylase family protein [Vicinamibacterales bacterium]|nr:polysaccharide deacetylase family protein [Vicinamibacterales bacterium]
MNIFTVDVEEWFHVCGVGGRLDPSHWHALPSRVVSTTRRLLDALDAAGVPATFFVVGWVADRHPALVQEILSAGHEVGSHSHWHRRVYELTPQVFADDLEAGINALVAAGAPRPTSFRAPEWSIDDRTPWALDVLARKGFAIDASMAPLRMVGRIDGPRHPHVRTTASGDVLEVPPFVADQFGQVLPMGWGWGLRMSSPQRVLSSIARANELGHPAVLTVHPWELDPDPPRVWLPPRLMFAHYFRLRGFERRLKDIMKGTTFSTLRATAPCASAS